MNNILCMKWGDKYDDSYVEKLKEQCEANCSIPFKFWCFTDKPEKDWHIPIPTTLDKFWIVRGWWNDIHMVKQNYAKHKSTPINSSAILWKSGQMMPVWEHVKKHNELIFFTYASLDNYFAHHWYDPWNEDDGFLQGFPQGDIYSWYKGNVFPDDMELKKLRLGHKICLFNNSKESNVVGELKSLW